MFDRPRLLSDSVHRHANQPASQAPYVLALPFSLEAEARLKTGVLRDDVDLLPPHLSDRRRLIAWYAAPKLTNLLFVPGRHAAERRFTPYPPP